MTSPLNELTCDHCGYRFIPDTPVNWCPKCARRIYTSHRQRTAGRISIYYTYAAIIAATILLTYLFFELVIVPIIHMPPTA